MKQVLALIKKDWLLLINNPKDLILHLLLSFMLTVMIAFGINSYILDRNIYPELSLIFTMVVFVLTGSILLSKNLEAEIEQGSLNNFIVRKVDLSLLYLSKVIVNFLTLTLGLLLSFLILSLLLSVTFINQAHFLLLIALLVSFAYSALSTLLSALTCGSKYQALLLPLLLIPLVFPIFFAGMELTFNLILNQEFSFLNNWFTLLCFLNILYLVLGINLYSAALKS